jgi:uncharacterized membrane protein YtjA (UPF0391 family)
MVRQGQEEACIHTLTCVAWSRADGTPSRRPGELVMLNYAIVFLVIALVAAVLGFSGIAAGAAGIAKILFVVFLVLAIAGFVFGRRRGS